MNPTTTPEPVDIARLRELEAKACSAPWKLKDRCLRDPYGSIIMDGSTLSGADFMEFKEDADFIAALRNAAPDLLSEVERLRMEIKAERQKSKVLGGIADVRLKEIRAIKSSVVDEVGGVDFEGNPTSEINYLQRLRILLKAESERDKLREEVERLNEKVGSIKRAAMDAVGECETWADVLSNGPTIRAERDDLRRENEELKQRLAAK